MLRVIPEGLHFEPLGRTYRLCALLPHSYLDTMSANPVSSQMLAGPTSNIKHPLGHAATNPYRCTRIVARHPRPFTAMEKRKMRLECTLALSVLDTVSLVQRYRAIAELEADLAS